MINQSHRSSLLVIMVLLASACTSAIALMSLSPHALQAAQPIYLRVDQVGYLPTESKTAFALTNESLVGQAFNVITDPFASVVFTNTVGTDRGVYGAFAHLYELNLAGFTTSGVYRLRLGSNTSPAFAIGANAYSGIISPTLQFFRVQRCGNTTPLLYAVCHLTDGTVANGTTIGTHINATGGWHDAGDYMKFTNVHGFATVLMLHAYQRHPQVFADADRNNVPDELDEARIGLDWMMKMWEPSKQVLYYQVGDYHDHSNGWRMPEGDDVNFPNRPVWACEPGKGANVAGKAAAALALAASLWGDPTRSFYNPTLASTHLTAAQQIYAYGKARPAVQPSTSDPTTNPPLVFYNDGTWQDKMALAAAELYRATGNATYLTDARNYAIAAGSAWEFDWASVHALAHYEIARLDPSYKSNAATFLQQDLSAYQTNFNANRFRAAMSNFFWGSGEAMVGAALTALWYEDLTGASTYRAMALAQRDYVLGGNPWGVSFVNSIGTNWPHHPHHQVADIKNSELVGFWNEGPVPLAIFQAQGITLSAPDAYALFQTNDAVYHDDREDYTTNEPTISMNAVGVALTSWFAPAATTSAQLYLPMVMR